MCFSGENELCVALWFIIAPDERRLSTKYFSSARKHVVVLIRSPSVFCGELICFCCFFFVGNLEKYFILL